MDRSWRDLRRREHAAASAASRKSSASATSTRSVRLLKDPEVRVKDVARRFGVSVGTVYKQLGAVAPEK